MQYFHWQEIEVSSASERDDEIDNLSDVEVGVSRISLNSVTFLMSNILILTLVTFLLQKELFGKTYRAKPCKVKKHEDSDVEEMVSYTISDNDL